MRDDLPERYERQMQLYALLWKETFDEWPIAAEVVYPFASQAYAVSIDPNTCQRVGEEARQLITRIQSLPVTQLASPGEVCKVCEFRPWCRPFWWTQGHEQAFSLARERAYLGVEGSVLATRTTGEYVSLTLSWHATTISLTLSLARFPHARDIAVNDTIRLLGARLIGMRNRLQAEIGEATEVFVVRV